MSLEDVNRDLRDYRRYAGDGLSPPNPYALPHGDPSTGAHIVPKAVLRERFGRVETLSAHMEDLYDLMEGMAGDVAAASNVPIFGTVNSAASVEINPLLPVIQVTGRSVAGTGWGLFRRVSSSVKGPGRFQDAGGQWWLPFKGTLSVMNGTDEIVIGVGTTGDYPDLPTAFGAMLKFADSGGTIELRLVSPISRTDLLKNADFSAFSITSSIGTVPLASGFTGFRDSDMQPPGDDRGDNLICGYGCRMPTLACVIDMAHQGGDGYYAIWNVSRAMVLPGCGVINAGMSGLVARNSLVTAHRTIWDGAMLHGIRAAYASSVAAQASSANDCVQFPELVDASEYDDYNESLKGAAAIDCSRNSLIHFRDGSAQRSGGSGINGRRAARLVVERANFSGAKYYGMMIQHAATVSAYGVTIENCGYDSAGAVTGGYALWLRDGYISLNGGTLRGSGNAAGYDVRIGDSSPVSSGAIVNASNVTTTNGLNKVRNFNVDRFNFPTRYGIVWNGAAESPWDIGEFDAEGDTAGKKIDDTHVLQSSVISTSDRGHQTYHNPNGQVGRISTQGSQTKFETTSDEALKVNIRPLADILAGQGGDIADLMRWLSAQIVGFDWLSAKDLTPTGQAGVGVIAQRLAERIPDAVSPRQGEPGTKDWQPSSVDYGSLTPYALAGWGVHEAEITALKAEIADLRARIEKC